MLFLSFFFFKFQADVEKRINGVLGPLSLFAPFSHEDSKSNFVFFALLLELSGISCIHRRKCISAYHICNMIFKALSCHSRALLFLACLSSFVDTLTCHFSPDFLQISYVDFIKLSPMFKIWVLSNE